MGAGPKRTVADEMKVTGSVKKKNREKSLRAVMSNRFPLRLTIAKRLMKCDQAFVPGNSLFVRKALKNEILRLPLQNVGHLAP
jgi:hypothetical protein